jgi:hypothetical protein
MQSGGRERAGSSRLRVENSNYTGADWDVDYTVGCEAENRLG